MRGVFSVAVDSIAYVWLAKQRYSGQPLGSRWSCQGRHKKGLEMLMMSKLLSVASAVFLIVSCSSYSKHSRAWLSEWVSASVGVVSLSNSAEVASAKIARLDYEDEKMAERWLLQSGQGSALLSEMPNAIPLTRIKGLKREPGEEVYLVRSASDGGNGVFSAHVNASGILVLYNVMGACGMLERRVLVVSLVESLRGYMEDVRERCNAVMLSLLHRQP